ncbi:MAG: HAD-IIA family hydrolase [Pseudomonadota bacterium]
MMRLSADEAFRAYEAVRHRLPRANPADTRPQRVATLADIADQFDVFLLDAFGVLNIGETAIPGTRERIDGLRAQGKRVLVVSNAASISHAELGEKYARLGFDFAPHDIVTSRATMAALAHQLDGLHWGVMAPVGAVFEDLGPLRMTPLGDEAAAYRAVDGFLLIGSGNWTELRQSLLEAALRERPRRVLVANPDIVAPRETGFSAEPGHFAHRLADVSGIEPEFFGKPFPSIFDLAFDRIGPVDRDRTLMVGDSLHTDILGAQSVGVASALVSGYGFHAGQDVNAVIARSGIVPDYVVDRP